MYACVLKMKPHIVYWTTCEERHTLCGRRLKRMDNYQLRTKDEELSTGRGDVF